MVVAEGDMSFWFLSSGFWHGGGERDRTDGLLRARQALSQLSYTPVSDDRRQTAEDRLVSRLRRQILLTSDNGGPRWT